MVTEFQKLEMAEKLIFEGIARKVRKIILCINSPTVTVTIAIKRLYRTYS